MAAPKNEFGQRLKEAFEHATNAQIAKKLGIAEGTVGFYVRGRIPEAETLVKISKITNRSVDWLLTGREFPSELERIQNGGFDPILNREALTDLIKEVFYNLWHQEVQNLGVIDEFDVASAVQKHDNAGLVLRDWYAHDGIDMPGVESTRPSGWQKMSHEQKVKEIKAVRGIMDRQQSRKAHAPKQPKPSKKI